jgi:predicted porin
MAAAYARIRQNAEQIIPTAIPEWMNQWMVGGSYDFKTAKVYAGLFEGNGPANPANLSAAATLGAVGANSQAFSWTKNRIAWLAGRVPVGRDAVIFQIARESYPYRAMATGSSTIVAAVYEHVLSPRTLLYANYGQVTNNSTARTPLFSAIPVVATSFGGSPRALALGIRHSF